MNSRAILHLAVYLSGLVILALSLPRSVLVEGYGTLVTLGVIGLWRFSWWFLQVLRALCYTYFIFPQRQLQAQQLWHSGWRPSRLYFMMTTFRERPSTTHLVLQSILNECRQIQVPVKLYIGFGDEADVVQIQHFFARHPFPAGFELIPVRQQQPGKRFAISETLRVMKAEGLNVEDIIVFMDGDSYFEPGCLSHCLPFFALFPKMQALTTHERVIVKEGPSWVQKWLDMRFAQRDLTMRSHTVSGKVLTLTGRMSIFRGKHVCDPEFIELIAQDHLHHWLWGKFRFLSGDDKSTWYFLLKKQADMYYIPSASVVTIEYIQGSGLARMKENLKRWSGNTLRNGARAMVLGPRHIGFFIWWCLIDQRCAMWTTLAGHLLVILTAIFKSHHFLWLSLWSIAFSRLCLASVLFFYIKRIDMSFPFLIYLNQVLTMLIKIYILFRLPQQRWKNRGDQKLGFNSQGFLRLRAWLATYLTWLYCITCLLLIMFGLQVIKMPALIDLFSLFP